MPAARVGIVKARVVAYNYIQWAPNGPLVAMREFSKEEPCLLYPPNIFACCRVGFPVVGVGKVEDKVAA